MDCYDAVSRGQTTPAARIDASAETSAERESEAAVESSAETSPEPVPDGPAAVVREKDDVAIDESDDERFVPLTDDVGRSDLKRGRSDEPKAILAQVTECRLGATGKYFFYFDNGQVWKQMNTGRQEFDVCDFSVTIKKDMFGYKMKPDTGARAVRIKRVR